MGIALLFLGEQGVPPHESQGGDSTVGYLGQVPYLGTKLVPNCRLCPLATTLRADSDLVLRRLVASPPDPSYEKTPKTNEGSLKLWTTRNSIWNF